MQQQDVGHVGHVAMKEAIDVGPICRQIYKFILLSLSFHFI